MRNTWLVFIVISALSFGSATVAAQSANTRQPDATERRDKTTAPRRESSTREPSSDGTTSRKPAIPESGLRFLSSEMSFSGKVVKHVPYSAKTLTENTRTLANGTRLVQKTTGTVYRDDEGRTRREMSASSAGPFATGGDTQHLIFINDPVSGTSTTILPESDTAVTKPMPANNEEAAEAEAPVENSRVESLGKKMIEGLVAEGTRTTIVIPAGSIGNNEPLEIVHERWYSPELQTILLSKHSDPRWGETVYKLFNIDRGTPDSSLFSLPANSTLREKKTRPRQ
ncbi:MAG: hypothetical protein J2P41_07035 [Blastocatellia bacterium]|nr:hypothetical protein [Blastocatellia bacterium]